MKCQLRQNATLAVSASHYAHFDGTSMATPHVTGVAALGWSYYPSCTGAQIRASLNKSALDLGAVGRDNKFGNGLVQAKAAHARIRSLGCGRLISGGARKGRCGVLFFALQRYPPAVLL